jgi:hypothetical protein
VSRQAAEFERPLGVAPGAAQVAAGKSDTAAQEAHFTLHLMRRTGLDG